ncbi:MAG TPA: sigma-70 family RNA polymerase sigma factor [Blastocatellia bacterium]|nr:sigma-70 family RNA polymerase sigma factor [Blastocatellia bacterium]
MTDSLGLGDAGNSSSLASLIERARAGEAAAFEQIITCYQRKVMSTAWRMLGNQEDARDAAQEVFLRAYKYLGSFRADQEFAGWLYRIVINVCRDHARKRSRHDHFSSFEAEQERGAFDSLASGENVEAAAIKSQERALIAAALNTLSKKERAAIVLRDLEGLPTEEVARVLGTSQATVRSQVASARAKIKLYRDRVLKQKRRG